MLEAIENFLGTTGIAKLFADAEVEWWKYLVMYLIVGVLFYLAIVKKFEPLLLMPIAFGMLLANLPGANLIHLDYFFDDFYIRVTESGAIEGTLSQHVIAFLDACKDNNFVYEIVAKSETTAGKILFSESVLNDSEFINLFNLHLGEIMTVNDTGFHIKMTTMIGEVVNNGGLLDILYLGVKLGIYPSLIFMGVGAMTDFSPLIANPKSLLMGAGAQFGVFVAFLAALLLGFTPMQSGAIGIIGGADGPTAIYVTSKLAPDLLGPIAVAAYSYMALVPVIQPPIMKLLTTKKERQIEMKQLREVSKTEKIIFPIIITTFVALLLPSAAPLVGCLMLGNLLRECGVCERLSKTVQNELMNIVTIFLGVSVGATATAEIFLTPKTLQIIAMGIVAFGCGTAGGVLLAKFMNLFLKEKINPLIGSAGVSAVPMAARVSQTVGQKENPKNFLLMHAMGPNVSGVIGSAIAAGAFLTLFLK